MRHRAVLFGLLLLIGGNMIREALFDREEALPDANEEVNDLF